MAGKHMARCRCKAYIMVNLMIYAVIILPLRLYSSTTFAPGRQGQNQRHYEHQQPHNANIRKILLVIIPVAGFGADMVRKVTQFGADPADVYINHTLPYDNVLGPD